MRVLLLGRKPVACDALRYMCSRGADVVAISTPSKSEPDPYSERLVDVADALRIPAVRDDQLYEYLTNSGSGLDLTRIDLVVSILHERRMRRPLLDLGSIGCVNFHPAPLPEYRGWGTYNVAILEDVKRWGVSAHFADDTFDTGPLIRVEYFDVDCSRETAFSLVRKTEPVLLHLFKHVFDLALRTGTLPSLPQGSGKTFTKNQVWSQRFILPQDAPELVERKIRAFWYPPNPCAEIQIGQRYYPVVNQAMIQDLVPLVCRQSPRLPAARVSGNARPYQDRTDGQ